MKKTIAIAAFAALTGTTMAALTVDISGQASWGFRGDPSNSVLAVLIGAGATITGIEWNVNLTTVGLSWADESNIGFHTDAGINQFILTPALGDPFPVAHQNYSSGGIVPVNIVIGPSGLLLLEFFETGFDDNPAAIDSFYEPGSVIPFANTDSILTLTGTGFVPTPGSLSILAIGGMVLTRRRRE